MKWSILVFVLVGAQAMAADPIDIPVRVVGSNVDLVADSPTVAPAAPANARLRVLERRRMGLTARNVVRVLREMKAEGKLAQYVSQGEDGGKEIDVSSLAAAVAGELASENPADWSDIDFDQILDFIEKLLELLIKFLPLIIDLFV